MEDSIPSSMKNPICSKELSAAAEESGWTFYLEDFLSFENEEAAPSNTSSTIGGGGGGSSMVSDAASYVAWNPPARVGTSDCSKKLSFRKKKERKASVDDSLEDTASSPVKDYGHMDMNTDKKVDTEIFQEKGNDCNNYKETETSEIGEASVAERGYGCNELRKKGLCLLPLSTLLDYLG
ncbi:vascular-related unknown protein 4-like isoform X2 [Typha angustifolia]|uniref:vascular-related unknown protein 4-like isoform X2 n=1 Tax=Typha angustifolia TaxID=59011 RepID=UPI003C2D2B81